jgi:hypothetical protein
MFSFSLLFSSYWESINHDCLRKHPWMVFYFPTQCKHGSPNETSQTFFWCLWPKECCQRQASGPMPHARRVPLSRQGPRPHPSRKCLGCFSLLPWLKKHPIGGGYQCLYSSLDVFIPNRPSSKQTSSCFRFKIPLTIRGKTPLHSLSKPWNMRATFAAIIVVELTFLLVMP